LGSLPYKRLGPHDPKLTYPQRGPPRTHPEKVFTEHLHHVKNHPNVANLGKSQKNMFQQTLQVPKMEILSYASSMDTAYVRESPPPKQLSKVKYLKIRCLNPFLIFG